MTGFYVWQYLPTDKKNIEKHILIFISALFINSIYAIYSFIDSVLTGKFMSYAGTPRVVGFWGEIIGGSKIYDPSFASMTNLADTGPFGMYLCISLIVNISYVFYKTPKPTGWRMKLAILSLCFGLIALFMTMSRGPIFAFLGSFLYLMFLNRGGSLYIKTKALSAIILIVFLSFLITNLFGINFEALLIKRLTTSTLGELNLHESRFVGTKEVFLYTIGNFKELWGHGMSSWRIYSQYLIEEGITEHGSGSLYNGYLTLLWDVGIIGIIVWAIWLKKHYAILLKIENTIENAKWLALSLKTILIAFLIVMLSVEYLNNFRLMGYFSFLMGLLLKYVYQNYSLKNSPTIPSTKFVKV